jgi:hypothetical protein
VVLVFVCIRRILDHPTEHQKRCTCRIEYINHTYRFSLRSLYSDHDGGVLIPAQERILSIPRLCVLNIGPSFEKVLMRHDASELSSDGTVDCFVDCKVGGEENVEESLMYLNE